MSSYMWFAWMFHLNKYLIWVLNHLKPKPFWCSADNMVSSTPSLLSLSLLSLSLQELDKLLSGPEIWRIIPLCWLSLGATPWIWMQCKWYDDSLWGNINFTIIQLFWVQRFTSWDNHVFCHETMNPTTSSNPK